ncbi:MAG: hypothetical protein Kow002_19160 [Anaerolineales bacterium]
MGEKCFLRVLRVLVTIFAPAAGVIGLHLSYYLSIASGAAVVLTATGFFVVVFLSRRLSA